MAAYLQIIILMKKVCTLISLTHSLSSFPILLRVFCLGGIILLTTAIARAQPAVCPPSPDPAPWLPGFNTNLAPPNMPQDPSIDPSITGLPVVTSNDCEIAILYEEQFDEVGVGVLGACASPVVAGGDPVSPTVACNYAPPSNGQWSITGSEYSLGGGGNPDYFRVVNGQLEGRDLDGFLCFVTSTIDISSVAFAGFSLDISHQDQAIEELEAQDELEVSYSVDGGPFVTVQTIAGNIAGNATTVDDSGISGSTLVIQVCFKNNNKDELYRLDNVSVFGEPENATTEINYQDILEPLGACAPPNQLVWQVTRIWTIIDECSNIFECEQFFQFFDRTAPTADCPPSPEGTLEWSLGFNTDPVEASTPQDLSIDPSITGFPLNVQDDCDPQPLVTYQDVLESLGDCDMPGQTIWRVTRTWTIVDDCGNELECVQVFEFIDTTAPTADCPPDPDPIEWTQNFNTDPVDPNMPQDPSIHPDITGFPTNVQDNCTPQPSVNYRDIIEFIDPCSPSDQVAWQVTRVWTIADDCGNALECIQVFEFVDTTAPTAECPPSPPEPIEWPSGFNTDPVDPNTPQDRSIDPSVTGMPMNVQDNCDPQPSVNYQDLIELVGSCENQIAWRVTRTWTIADGCANTMECVQTFEFTDMTAPTV